MTKQVMDGMVDRGWGRVVNVSSVNGSKGAFGQTNYSAAKAGIARVYQGTCTRGRAQRSDSQNNLARLHRHKNGYGDPQRSSGEQNTTADTAWPAWQTGGDCGPDHLSML